MAGRKAPKPEPAPARPAEDQPVGEIVRLLQPLMASYDPTGAATNKNIEDWYESAMDRISGLYKRKSQSWLFLIGILLSVGMNADTLRMFSILWNDTDIRKTLVDRAGRAADLRDSAAAHPDSQVKNLDRWRAELESLPSVLGWDRKLVDSLSAAALQKAKRNSAGQGSDALDYGLAWAGTWLGWVGGHPMSMAGWLMTAFAITFGAPFWFDVLNKFINIRNVGKKPEERPSPKA